VRGLDQLETPKPGSRSLPFVRPHVTLLFVFGGKGSISRYPCLASAELEEAEADHGP